MAGGGATYLLAVRTGLVAARVLPPGAMVRAAASVGRLAGLLSPARATVEANLRTAGRSHATAGDLFANYGRTWGEFLALAADPPLRRRWSVRCEGLDDLREASRRSAVCLLSGHCGNWDLGAAIAAEFLPNLAVVAERLDPPALFSWFVRQRARQGVRVIPADRGGARLYRHLRRGDHVAMLVDRVFGAASRPAPFLGGTRRFPSAGIDLARRAGAALVPAFVWRESGAFVFRVHPPLPEVGDPVPAFARILEQEVTARPEQWCVLAPARDAVEGSGPA